MSDFRVRNVLVMEHELCVALMDGRTIMAPFAWCPRLDNATSEQRSHWEIAGAGYGIHRPDVDEDLSTQGLLVVGPAPRDSEKWRSRAT